MGLEPAGEDRAPSATDATPAPPPHAIATTAMSAAQSAAAHIALALSHLCLASSGNTNAAVDATLKSLQPILEGALAATATPNALAPKLQVAIETPAVPPVLQAEPAAELAVSRDEGSTLPQCAHLTLVKNFGAASTFASYRRTKSSNCIVRTL